MLSTVQNHGLCGHFTPVVSNAGQTGPIERSSKKIFYLIILQAPNLAAFPKVYCIHMTTHACKVQPCRTLELQLDPITASFLVLTQHQHTKYQPREIPKCFTMDVAAATIQRINPTIQRPRCQLRWLPLGERSVSPLFYVSWLNAVWIKQHGTWNCQLHSNTNTQHTTHSMQHTQQLIACYTLAAVHRRSEIQWLLSSYLTSCNRWHLH